MNNPFNLSFGTVPSIFLDRDSLSKEVITKLNNENSPFQTSLIYGQRGAGKTTLMTDVANALNKDLHRQVVNLILDDDLFESLLAQLQEKLVDLKLFKGLGKSQLRGELGTRIGQTQVTATFHQLLERFTQRGIGILITIDGVKATPLLRKLISCYQFMLRDNLIGNVSEG